MPVAFPYVGTLTFVTESIVRELGRNDIMVPKKPSRKTMQLGASHAPEFICTPFKMVLGSFIEMIELGATELIEPGFVAYCRFGYYFPVHKVILEDLGYDFKFITMDYEKPLDILRTMKKYSNGCNYLQTLRALRIGWIKNRHIDFVDNALCRYRAVELCKGASELVAEKAFRMIVETKGMSNIRKLRTILPKMFEKEVEVDKKAKPLKVGIVGELYVVFEPSINLDIHRRLNELGVITHNPLTLRRWLDVGEKLNPFKRQHHKIAKRKAKPYIEYRLGGEAQESIGHTIMYKEKGWDGMVHLYPFTCMPEIIARSILPQVSKEYNIPILSLVLDEHTGETGFQTRLEAFIDLLVRKREEANIS